MAVAREIALRQLTIRARSSEELRRGLRRRGVPEETAHTVVTRFEEVGLVDDTAFARDWVSSPSRRLKGRRALAAELNNRGVAADAIDAALTEVTADQELESARVVARRRLAGMLGLDPLTRRRRLAGALARRGFDSATISIVLREVVDTDPGELA